MQNKNKISKNTDTSTPSSEGFLDLPESSYQITNKYGTYEIQPTADTANWFPAIAQGLPTQPSGRNKKKDNVKSKLKDNGKMWD